MSLDEAVESLGSGIEPPKYITETKTIEVHGREEHEKWLKDPQKMLKHGLDPYYETMVYLKRWGGWLDDK